MRHLTQERRDLARRLRSEGCSLREIGAALGVSHQRVGQMLGSASLTCEQCHEAVPRMRYGKEGKAICHACRKPPPRSPEEVAAIRKTAGFRKGAAKLGIPLDEYTRHREAGQRWCSEHRRWEAAELFSEKVRGRCRVGHAEAPRRVQGTAYYRDYYSRNQERLNAYQREYKRNWRAAAKAKESTCS